MVQLLPVFFFLNLRKINENILNTMRNPELDSGAEKGHQWGNKTNKIVLFSYYSTNVYFLVLITALQLCTMLTLEDFV